MKVSELVAKIEEWAKLPGAQIRWRCPFCGLRIPDELAEEVYLCPSCGRNVLPSKYVEVPDSAWEKGAQ